VANAHASEVGEIAFAPGLKPSRIEVTTEAESGDWIVYDRYRVGADGEPSSLTREVHIAQGDIRIREEYALANGTATRTLQVRVGRDGKVMPGRLPHDLPQLPIARTLKNFPFEALLVDRSIIGSPKNCVPDTTRDGDKSSER